MDSGTNTQTQTSTSEPYKAAQPTIDRALGMANSVADSGQAFAPNTQSNVVPWSSRTMTGQDAIYGNATRQLQSDGVVGEYQRAVSRGGFNAPQQSAVADLGRIGNQAMGPSYAEQNLSGIARGDMLDRLDPNFERSLAVARNNASNQIGEGASAAGRYGSQNWADNVAKTVGDYEATQRVNQYNNERANQMSANSMLDSSRFQGLGMGLNAAQGMFNAGQQGFQNLGAAYEGMKLPAQDLMNLGSMDEDLSGRQINDRNRILEDTRMSDLRKAEWLMGIGSGAGQLGGTSTGTAQTPGQNPFASALGYGATGLGMLGSAKNLGWF